MKKLFLTLIFCLISTIAFAGKPPVNLSKVIIAGANVAMTNAEGKGFPSLMFCNLIAGQKFLLLVNSELDLPHRCQVYRLNPDGSTVTIGWMREPGVVFTPAHDGLYGVACYTAPNQVDLIGIAFQLP